MYEFPLYLKISQYFTVQDCFATFKSRRFIQRMDRKNRWQKKYSRTLSTLPSVLVLGQAGEGELLSGDENRASVIQVNGDYSAALQHCAVCVVSGYMNTFQCLFSFGNLYYPEWEYPKCSLTINRKVSIKRLPDLISEHRGPALACHSNSQLLVCTDVCVCVSVNRGGTIPTAERLPHSSASWVLTILTLIPLRETTLSQVQWKIRGPWKIIFNSMSISGHRFPLQRSKNLLINCNSFM